MANRWYKVRQLHGVMWFCHQTVQAQQTQWRDLLHWVQPGSRLERPFCRLIGVGTPYPELKGAFLLAMAMSVCSCRSWVVVNLHLPTGSGNVAPSAAKLVTKPQ